MRGALRSDPALAQRRARTQDGGLRLDAHRRPRDGGRLGVSIQAVNDTLNGAFGQRQISTIYGQANQYRVVLEAAPHYQARPVGASAKLYVAGHGEARRCR